MWPGSEEVPNDAVWKDLAEELKTGSSSRVDFGLRFVLHVYRKQEVRT